MKKLTFVAIALALTSTAALANNAPSGGPVLDGATEIMINDVQTVNAAIGNESSATQEIMAVDAGNVTGDLTLEATAIDAVDAAIGNEACSDQKIGTVGSTKAC
jgi:hypothetical protein